MTVAAESGAGDVAAGDAGPRPVYLFAGVPDGLSVADAPVPPFAPGGLVWADERLDTVGDTVSLMRGIGADPSVLATLTGFAGLERLLVWGKARTIAETAPAGVRIGVDVDRQLSWLRRVQGPEQLADMMDLIIPRVDRHRNMPDVFGDRSRRAKLVESLWAWGRSWQRFLDSGGVRLLSDGPVDERVAAAAAWIGVVAEEGTVGKRTGGARPGLKLADLGRDGDGGHRFRVRVRAPMRLATMDGAAHDAVRGRVSVGAGESALVVNIAGWSRRFRAPAVLADCEKESVDVAPQEEWEDGWGDVLIGFRASVRDLPEPYAP